MKRLIIILLACMAILNGMEQRLEKLQLPTRIEVAMQNSLEGEELTPELLELLSRMKTVKTSHIPDEEKQYCLSLQQQASKNLIEMLAALKAIYPADITSEVTDFINYAKLWIEMGIDLNIKDQCGQTPLMSAVTINSKKIVKFLINNARVNVNVSNADKQTALMMAADLGHLKIVKLLLAASADSNLKDAHGLTALGYALMQKQKGIVTLLLATESVDLLLKIENGAYRGRTLFDLAQELLGKESEPMLLGYLKKYRSLKSICARAIAKNNDCFTQADFYRLPTELREPFSLDKLFKNICAVCSKRNVKNKCSRCKKVFYCSTQCQKKDWPQHKSNCKK